MFFNNLDRTSSLLATFSVFAVGFIARPLGGILFGYIGDKFGRKKTIILTISVMSIATSGIGILPVYSSIGIFSTILLISMRVLQGIASSGEHTGTVTYLSEISSEKRKTFLLSFSFFGVIIGMLMGSLMGSVIMWLFSEDFLLKFGWRIPFLSGSLLGIFGIFLRLRLHETMAYKNMRECKNLSKMPTIEVLKEKNKDILLIIGIFSLNAMAFYSFFVYFPAEIIHKGYFHPKLILSINSLNILFMSLTIPIVGYLSEKFSGLTFLKISSISFIILSYPAFLLINKNNILTIFIVQLILGQLNAIFLSPTPFIYSALFPNRIRYSGVSIAMNISATIFGGSSPVIMSYLAKSVHSIFFQSSYFSIVAFIAFICILQVPRRGITA